MSFNQVDNPTRPTIERQTTNKAIAARLLPFSEEGPGIMRIASDTKTMYLGHFPKTPKMEEQLLSDGYPADFKLPALTLSLDDETDTVTHPYGETSSRLQDPSGNLYMCSNWYTFNSDGQAWKVEYIKRRPNNTPEPFRKHPITKIQATPLPRELRIVPLTDKDYGKVAATLADLESNNNASLLVEFDDFPEIPK